MCVITRMCACGQTCVSRFAQTAVLINSIFTNPVLAWITGTVIMVDLTVHTYIGTEIKSHREKLQNALKGENLARNFNSMRVRLGFSGCVVK